MENKYHCHLNLKMKTGSQNQFLKVDSESNTDLTDNEHEPVIYRTKNVTKMSTSADENEKIFYHFTCDIIDCLSDKFQCRLSWKKIHSNL